MALFANGALAKISLDTGRITDRLVLAPGVLGPLEGRLLAVTPNRRTIYALLPPTVSDGHQEILAVDLRKMRVLRRIALPGEAVFRAILFGAATGRIYLVGDRSPSGTSQGREVVVALFDPKTLRLAQAVVVRDAAGRNWSVFDAAIDRSERYLYVSYHGSCVPPAIQMCTTGADWFAITGSTLASCPKKADEQAGCLAPVHGRVEAFAGDVLATTGDGPLIRITRSNTVVRRWPTGIPRSHLLQFAVNPRGDHVYFVGPCAYIGGLSSVDLKTGKALVRRYFERGGSRTLLCGDRVAAGRSRLLIVKNATPAQALLVADARTLKVVRSIGAANRVVDVLAFQTR